MIAAGVCQILCLRGRSPLSSNVLDEVEGAARLQDAPDLC